MRRARVEDKARVMQVEAKATPNLRYLGTLFDHWVHDREGELIVAEMDGALAGVGKFTVLPDGSAWLEALRVSPDAQGQGLGKRFYQRFFEIARERKTPAMRMYTGLRNVRSKGLAERYGFHLAATYRGAGLKVELDGAGGRAGGFLPVTDPSRAKELLLPFALEWTGFLVMNRTFYAVTPALGAAWAAEGKVYHDPATDSVLVLGARFQADLALHISCMRGDLTKCLAFAREKARELSVLKLQCLFPAQSTNIEESLVARGYELDPGDYIVMEVTL